MNTWKRQRLKSFNFFIYFIFVAQKKAEVSHINPPQHLFLLSQLVRPADEALQIEARMSMYRAVWLTATFWKTFSFAVQMC